MFNATYIAFLSLLLLCACSPYAPFSIPYIIDQEIKEMETVPQPVQFHSPSNQNRRDIAQIWIYDHVKRRVTSRVTFYERPLYQWGGTRLSTMFRIYGPNFDDERWIFA